MTDATAADPAAIEREIRRTQDDMSRTVDKIGDQLSFKNVFNALLDKADENNVDARMLLDGARRNPVALGLIAAGAIWLVSDKDAKMPSLPAKLPKFKGDKAEDGDVHHRDYVSHMAAIEQRSDEDAFAYQRRRDTARSNFFMVERDHEEDDSSFRKRLDGMTDRFREQRQAWSRSAGRASAVSQQAASAASHRVSAFYTGNPVVGGLIAGVVGAAVGATLPSTQQERNKFGGLGEKARDVIDDQKQAVTSQLQDKKDQLFDKAEAALQPSWPAEESSMQGRGNEPGQHHPFIAAT